jgi:hypothetical protein
MSTNHLRDIAGVELDGEYNTHAGGKTCGIQGEYTQATTMCMCASNLCNLATTTTGYTMITLAFMAVAMWFSG